MVTAHLHCSVYSLPDAEDSDESSAFFLCIIDDWFSSCYHVLDKLDFDGGYQYAKKNENGGISYAICINCIAFIYSST